MDETAGAPRDRPQRPGPDLGIDRTAPAGRAVRRPDLDRLDRDHLRPDTGERLARSDRLAGRRRAREMQPLSRVPQPPPGLVGRDHEVDQAFGPPPARQMQRRVLAIGAGWRQHHLGAGQISGAGGLEDAAPDPGDRPFERLGQAAGEASLDQLLAKPLDGPVGRRRDAGRGRRRERQAVRLGQSAAAIGIAAGLRVEAQPAAAAAEQEMLAGRGQRLEPCHQLVAGRARSSLGGFAIEAQQLGRQPCPVGVVGRERLMGCREPSRQRREAPGALARRQDGAVAGGDPAGQKGSRPALLVQELRPAEPLPERQLQGVTEDQRGAEWIGETVRVEDDPLAARRAERQVQRRVDRKADAGAERTQLGPGRGQPDREAQMVGRPLLHGSRRGGAEQRAGPGIRVRQSRLP